MRIHVLGTRLGSCSVPVWVKPVKYGLALPIHAHQRYSLRVEVRRDSLRLALGAAAPLLLHGSDIRTAA